MEFVDNLIAYGAHMDLEIPLPNEDFELKPE